MSLILDALNRSRTEQDEVPTLVTRHDYGDSRPAAKMLVLAIALLLAIAVIAWLLWERASDNDSPPLLTPAPGLSGQADSGPTAVPPAARQAPTGAEPAPVPAPRPQAPAPQALPAQSPVAAADSTREAVSSLYRQDPPPVTPAAQPKDEAEPQADPPAAASDSAIEEMGVDIEELVQAAEDELQNVRLAEHPAPFIVDLSQRTKDAIPSIIYERHDYSGRPGQSLVVLNGKALKPGDSPASGLRVEEILPDSVVLDYRGTQFRLRALNSWVNL